MALGELGGRERQAADLVVADDVDEVLARAAAARAGRGSSRGRAPCRSGARTSPRFGGNGLRWRRCAWATGVPGACGPARHAGADRAVGRAPAEHQHARRRRSGRRPRAAGSSSAMPSTLAWRGADHEVVVGRVVGDVAGAVGLLDAADAVLEARACRGSPTAGPASPGRAGRARRPGCRPRRCGWARWRSSTRQVGQVGDVRDAATARSRWRGSRRRAGTPACGRSTAIRHGLERGVEAVRRATAARRSAPAPRRCGRTSPAAGRPARSWSAARSTGRRAARRRRPAAARVITARPIVSDFSAMPGPGRGGDAERAAERRAERRADAGDLVLGLERA